jgi:hypothetical protein
MVTFVNISARGFQASLAPSSLAEVHCSKTMKFVADQCLIGQSQRATSYRKQTFALTIFVADQSLLRPPGR